jgi:hypothetical protein
MDEDGVRDDRCRRHAVRSLNYRVHLVGRQGFECRILGRPGKRMRVLPHIERTINTVSAPVVADRLSDGEDMGFAKGPAKRRAAVPAGAEGDALFGVVGIGAARVIIALKTGEIDQHLLGCRLAGERRNFHLRRPF